MTHQRTINIVAILLWLVMVACVILLTASCNPQKRLLSMAARHPDAAANICAKLYPVKESTTVRIDTVTTTVALPPEYVMVDCDSAVKYRYDTTPMLVRVPCPPTQLITKLITKDSIVKVENTAALAAIRGDLTKSRESFISCRNTRNMLWWVAGLLAAYTAIRVVLKIYTGKSWLI